MVCLKILKPLVSFTDLNTLKIIQITFITFVIYNNNNAFRYEFHHIELWIFKINQILKYF